MTYEEKYNHFDVNLLMGRKGEVVSTKEALQDIVPILWEKNICEGKNKSFYTRKNIRRKFNV